MTLYIFIPYDPAFAELREFDNDIEAIEAFAKWAAEETSASAHLVDSSKRCLAHMGDGELTTDVPMEAFLGLEDDGRLAEHIIEALRQWLYENIDYPVMDKVMVDLVDELFAAGFQNSITMAWPTIKQYLVTHSFVSKGEQATVDAIRAQLFNEQPDEVVELTVAEAGLLACVLSQSSGEETYNFSRDDLNKIEKLHQRFNRAATPVEEL